MKAWTFCKGIILVTLLCVGITSAFSEGDNENWKYGREITISQQSGIQQDFYSLPVTLNAGNFDFAKANPDGSDLRITDNEGYERAFWIEEWAPSERAAKIWITVPRIPSNGQILMRMYYGNPGAASVSNGGATFLFFDDFNRTAINYENWQISGKTIKQENGYLILPAGTEPIRCMITASRPVMVHFRYRAENGNNFPGAQVSLLSSPDFVYGGNGTAYTMKISNNQNSAQGNIITKGADYRILGGSPQAGVDTSVWNAYSATISEKTLQGSWGGISGPQVADDSLNLGTLVVGTECEGRCNGYAEWDWIFVRKYAETEPVVKISEEYPAGQLLVKAVTRIPGSQDMQPTQKSSGLLLPVTICGAVIALVMFRMRS